MPTVSTGSIRFTGACVFATGTNNLLNAQTNCGVAFRAQFNSNAGSGTTSIALINKNNVYPALLGFGINAAHVGVASVGFAQSSPSYFINNFAFQLGIPNHILISYASSLSLAHVFVNGTLAGSYGLAGATSAYGGPLQVGPNGSAPLDLQISDLSFYSGSPTQQDAINLYAGLETPLTISAPAQAWFSLGGTAGRSPVFSDAGFQDLTGNGYAFTSGIGAPSTAVYAGSLGFTPPIETAARVSKSGRTLYFFPVATVPAPNGYNVPQVVTSIPANPVVTLNNQTVQADGPTWGSTSGIFPFLLYRLQCGGITGVGIASGGTGMVSPAVTASGGGASVQATFGTPVLAYGVTSYTVEGATGYTSAPTITLSSVTHTTPPLARAVYAAGSFTIVPNVGGVEGCGSGLVTAPMITATGGGGTYTSITANLGWYIQYVPVESPGQGYTSLPALTVTDAGGGSGASLVAVMSGAAPGDVLSYTAPWGWLQCGLGGAPSSPLPGSTVPATVANYAGSVEGAAGLLQGFSTVKTMRLGINMGAAQTAYNSPNGTPVNYAHRIGLNDSNWSVSSGTLVTLVDGTPYSWSPDAILTYEIYSTNIANPIDDKATPSLFGVWTFIYADPNAGTSNAAVLGMEAVATTLSGPTRTVSGTTVTVAYDFAPSTQQNIVLRLTYSQPQGLWTISGLTIIPPTASAPANAIVQSNLGTDQNIINWVTSRHGQTPAYQRSMDSDLDYGGGGNFIDPSDIPPATRLGWGGPKIPATVPYSTTDAAGNTIPSGTVQWAFYRPYNTNPNDGTYGWSSPNLYSTQYGLTGTDSYGPYLALPPTDNGRFLYGAGSAPWTNVAIELVSVTRHGLKSGLLANFSGGAGDIIVTGASGPVSLTGASLILWVTGPYTAVVVQGCSVSSGTTISRVAGTVEIATTVSCTIQIPQGDTCPYGFAGARASQTKSGAWISVPVQASPATSATLASEVFAELTPGLKVAVEYGNECWNDTTNNYYVAAIGYLAGYLPTGTSIGNYYKTTNGVFLTLDQAYTLLAAMHHDIWYNIAVSLGRGGDVVRVFGAQDSNPSHQIQMVQFATQVGIPMDLIVVAPYYEMAGDPLFVATFEPAGYAGTPGNFPVDALADIDRHCFYFNTMRWGWYAGYAACAAAWGQSCTAMGLGIGAPTGGSLPAGGYYGYFTYVDVHGNETTVGNSQSGLVVASAGDVLLASFPALPVWAVSINLYLTPTNNVPETQVLYASGITGSTFSLTSGLWVNGTVPSGFAPTPPTTNKVPLSHAPPKMGAYECAPQRLTAPGTPFSNQLARDMFYHPSFYDVINSFLFAMQVGHPAVANSGLEVACFFQLCWPWGNDGAMWGLAVSTSQTAGYGLMNKFITAQGGFPANGLTHDGDNEAVGIQAYRDWVDIPTPPVPSVVATVPAVNAVSVSASVIEATFSEPITPGSLSFAIAPTMGGPNLSGTVSLDITATTATFTPRSPLGYATGYTATISATSVGGTAMPTAYRWSWTTAVAPPWAATEIPTFAYGFAVPINSAGLTITATGGGVNFPGATTYNPSSQVATFTPTTPFAAGATYTLTIAGAIILGGSLVPTVVIIFSPSVVA